MATYIDKGKTHDFRMFKESRLPINRKIKIKADLGYCGIKSFHANSEVPKKSSKNHPLSEEDKEYNRILASSRIYIEHINAKIKTFKIFSQKYRNRISKRRFLLRFNLVCGFINYEKFHNF